MGDTNGKSIFDKPKRKQQTTSEAFKSFIWNTETSEFCGRTGLSWFKITAFYIVFFTCLALFFMAMLSLFFMTISDDEPRWKLSESLIGTNPGVGFRPMPDQEKNPESTLIWINTQKEEPFWEGQLEAYFDKYYRKQQPDTNLTCSFKNGDKADAKTPCDVNLNSLNVPGFGCNKANKYGLSGKDAKPCILVKLNKIFGWNPEPIATEQDVEYAQEKGMPDDLANKINALIGKQDDVSRRELQTTWISCSGENPADRENIGPIEYWAPGFDKQFQGIPNYYFPYEMQKGYKSPFVFIKFLKPEKNVLIQIECKAWAKNIVADRFLRLGSVHFEIMLD